MMILHRPVNSLLGTAATIEPQRLPPAGCDPPHTRFAAFRPQKIKTYETFLVRNTGTERYPRTGITHAHREWAKRHDVMMMFLLVYTLFPTNTRKRAHFTTTLVPVHRLCIRIRVHPHPCNHRSMINVST